LAPSLPLFDELLVVTALHHLWSPVRRGEFKRTLRIKLGVEIVHRRPPEIGLLARVSLSQGVFFTPPYQALKFIFPVSLVRCAHIAKKNNGVFPFDSVYEIIDGRKTVIAHGTRDMPIWGDRYMPEPNRTLIPRPSENVLNLSTMQKP
jgi:hypothetical protein